VREAVFGKTDYEHFLTVLAADKDRVLLALIEELYSGNAPAISEFREFLVSKGIASQFRSFWASHRPNRDSPGSSGSSPRWHPVLAGMSMSVLLPGIRSIKINRLRK
jgi:hypothetical protein